MVGGTLFSIVSVGRNKMKDIVKKLNSEDYKPKEPSPGYAGVGSALAWLRLS